MFPHHVVGHRNPPRIGLRLLHPPAGDEAGFSPLLVRADPAAKCRITDAELFALCVVSLHEFSRRVIFGAGLSFKGKFWGAGFVSGGGLADMVGLLTY